MRALHLTIAVLASALVAACDAEEPAKTPEKAPTQGTSPPKVPTRTVSGTQRELPKLPALTPEIARRVLNSQLQDLGGDDASRQALLYYVDLGDRQAVNAIHEKLLVVHEGKFEDLPGAAVGVEALLAYGEKDASAKALQVARQYKADEEDPDDYLVRLLGRVTGSEKDAAVIHTGSEAYRRADGVAVIPAALLGV